MARDETRGPVIAGARCSIHDNLTFREGPGLTPDACASRHAYPGPLTGQCDISTGTVIDESITLVTPPQTSWESRGRL